MDGVWPYEPRSLVLRFFGRDMLRRMSRFRPTVGSWMCSIPKPDAGGRIFLICVVPYHVHYSVEMYNHCSKAATVQVQICLLVVSGVQLKRTFLTIFKQISVEKHEMMSIMDHLSS